MTFKISKLLSPIIAFDDVVSFYCLFQTTEGLISSSLTLQFFDRRAFDWLASLDIYVQYQKLNIINAWLWSHGTIGVPQDQRDTNIAADLHITSEIWTILKFNVPNSSQIIHLILTRCNPLISVLCFHSGMFFLVQLRMPTHSSWVMHYELYLAWCCVFAVSPLNILWPALHPVGNLICLGMSCGLHISEGGLGHLWGLRHHWDGMPTAQAWFRDQMCQRPQVLEGSSWFRRALWHLDFWWQGLFMYSRMQAGLSGQWESDQLFKLNMLLICEGD